MNWSMPSVALMGALGALHGVFLSTALARSPRGNAAANRVLAILLGLFSLQIANSLIYHSGLILDFPHLAALQTPTALAFGPLLFLFVRIRLQLRVFSATWEVLHFLPVLLLYGYLMPFYLQDTQTKIDFLNGALAAPPTLWRIRTIIGIVQIAVYIGLSVFCLKAKPTAKVPDKKVCGLLILVLSLFWFFGVLRFLFAYHIQTNLIIPASLSLAIYWIGYFYLVQGDRQTQIKGKTNSSIMPEHLKEKVTALNQRMAKDLLFTDPELSLERLAAVMNMPPAQLSRLINEGENQNFNDFVNRYRVARAKYLLANPDYRHISILGVAQDAGFKSKTTFYAAFKKHGGGRPADFRHP